VSILYVDEPGVGLADMGSVMVGYGGAVVPHQTLTLTYLSNPDLDALACIED